VGAFQRDIAATRETWGLDATVLNTFSWPEIHFLKEAKADAELQHQGKVLPGARYREHLRYARQGESSQSSVSVRATHLVR
jgi:hypothetical protein